MMGANGRKCKPVPTPVKDRVFTYRSDLLNLGQNKPLAHNTGR